ncbi:interferon regulatory factor 10 isoform X2 [Triplophysa dalaica]|uniref:interferon regulatory factor 10 isoform X2 n=1 Tax=Triplophysa dalaica TaxID=1582913 RepID=UPI0024DFAD40|nr:interferon regulatory factor 10 isoform X2 [Triplophysa dalaica]
MEDLSKHMRLREWLIAQIDSGKYPGLSWENHEKSMFKIPWKHAAKQDYRQNQDAALFKAWAMYKGKFQEGKDKADPSTWKTRLRCALNKSTDFKEVPERSQLDISEPFKVYRILDDTGRGAEMCVDEEVIEDGALRQTHLLMQVSSLGESNREWSERTANGLSYACTPGIDSKGHSQCVPSTYLSQVPLSDCRLEVRLFYHGEMVHSTVSASPDGCFILQGCAPLGNERIYGPCQAKKVFFPGPDIVSLSPGITEAMSRLLPHLEKGVLVWVAPDGVFIKRFCQGRVYWDGPLAEHREKPNKLERERTCKLLDMNVFSQELQNHWQGTGPEPRYVVDLCFGEEFPDSSQPKSKKLITAQVIPLFAVECIERHDPSKSVEMKPSPSQRSCMQSHA